MNKKEFYELLSEHPARVQDLVNNSDMKDPIKRGVIEFLLSLDRDLDYDSVYGSPIEEIFEFAYNILIFYTGASTPYMLERQKTIHTSSGRTYIADFYFDGERTKKCAELTITPKNPLRLVIECDGHEFHERTKEQVEYSNIRDYDLKIDGYECLHFSGRQIYKDPLMRACEVLEFIDKKIGGWIVNGNIQSGSDDILDGHKDQ